MAQIMYYRILETDDCFEYHVSCDKQAVVEGRSLLYHCSRDSQNVKVFREYWEEDAIKNKFIEVKV